jgi:hypothetical protein
MYRMEFHSFKLTDRSPYRYLVIEGLSSRYGLILQKTASTAHQNIEVRHTIYL